MRSYLSGILCLCLLMCAANLLNAQEQKSLPENHLHDKIHHIIVESELTVLPDSVESFLGSLLEPANNISHKQIQSLRGKLKVLYNPKIGKEDKVFLCKYLLEQNNEFINSLTPLINEHLKINSF